MKATKILLFLISILSLVCCKQKKKVKMLPKDTSITPKTAYLNLFMNEADIVNYATQKHLNEEDSSMLVSYYNNRNMQYAWFDTAGITEHALNFMNLCTGYATSINDSSLVDSTLAKNIELLSDSAKLFTAKPEQLKQTELGLSAQFFRYIQKAYNGIPDLDPAKLDWFIPRKKVDAKTSLDSLLKAPNQDSLGWLKVSPQFQALLNVLKQYNTIAANGGWDSIPMPIKSYKLKDSSDAVLALKKRLFAEGDLKEKVEGGLFDSATRTGLIAFQKRMGLTEDGAAGKNVVNELNTPVQQRIQTIRLNLERMRWTPASSNDKHILVNIPAYRLYVFDSGKTVMAMNVVVGKPANSTVIFSGQMKYVVMAPYWNVPYSIVEKELGNHDAAWFAKRNMEITGRYANGLPMLREKPGPANSLGRVKFLFPNSYSIYLHDTPAKDRFNQTDRAFSHGCIRLGEPDKLAYYMLQTYPEWPKQKIDSIMNSNKETWVTLKQTVPVTIGYFTAWVDAEGKINFRKDIYGHDKKMAERLFNK